MRRPRKVVESIVPKERLAAEIARVLDDEGITQTEAAWRAKDSPSQISLIVTGKTRGFSAERLIRLLTKLGRDVDIVIRPTRSVKSGKVRLNVR